MALAAPSLSEVILAGCVRVGDSAVVALAAHCGASLEVVDLRRCSGVSDVSIFSLAASCPGLRRLAAGGAGAMAEGGGDARAVGAGSGGRISDASLGALARNCRSLESLTLTQCTRLGADALLQLAEPLESGERRARGERARAFAARCTWQRPLWRPCARRRQRRRGRRCPMALLPRQLCCKLRARGGEQFSR